MSDEKVNVNVESVGRLVGGVIGVTLMTMWITVVATITYNWYMGIQ